jgi:hypothetical protein
LVSLLDIVGVIVVKVTGGVEVEVIEDDGSNVGADEGFVDGFNDGVMVGSLLKGCCVGLIDGCIV